MKKVFFAFATLAMLFTSCSDDQKQTVQEENINMDDWFVYTDADLDETSRIVAKNYCSRLSAFIRSCSRRCAVFIEIKGQFAKY